MEQNPNWTGSGKNRAWFNSIFYLFFVVFYDIINHINKRDFTMKYFVSVLVMSLMVCDAFAAGGRPAMSNKIMSAPRYTASINQLNGITILENNNGRDNNDVMQVTTGNGGGQPQIDQRDAERNACINNNIGVGNTFVWASRYSNTSNYATMVEDTANPQNNVCFVRVELKSDDETRISVADVPAKYFMWGENIECGGWANKKDIEQRILDARKGARIGGIVASSVGGAGLGVGIMELFGNRIIGGKVEGQKDLKDDKLYRSQMLVLRENNSAQFERYRDDLAVLKKACAGGTSGLDCSKYQALIDEFAK